MTKPDYRILITKMADELDQCHQLLMDDRRQRHPLADRARALLAEPRIISRDRDETGPYVVVAQPEPEGPTIGDVMQLWASTPHIDEAEGAIAFARAVLARWGRPAAAPVPVSERLPGPEDCTTNPRTGQGQWCWGWVQHDPIPYSGRWRMMRCEWLADEAVAWLPANALPTPEAQP